MPVNWKDPDAYNRLFAAMVAANDMKPFDYRRIATYYGNGATYDAIEGRFRNFKKIAKTMYDELGPNPAGSGRGANSNHTTTTTNNNNDNTATTPKKTRTTPANTPSKKDNNSNSKTLSGRISKTSSNSPTKRSNGNNIFNASNGANGSFQSIKSEPASTDASFVGSASGVGSQMAGLEDIGEGWVDGDDGDGVVIVSGNGLGDCEVNMSFENADLGSVDVFEGLEVGV